MKAESVFDEISGTRGITGGGEKLWPEIKSRVTIYSRKRVLRTNYEPNLINKT